jgi:DNA-binding transcriptional ArsR family regulator
LGALLKWAKVSAATLTQPEKSWYLSELAEFLGTTRSSLQRDLKALVDGGILQSRREGTRAYFKADTRSPLYPDLRGLIEKTAGVVPTLRGVLQPFQTGIAAPSCTDRWPGGRNMPLSGVDLLVVGDIGPADLATVLRTVETRLGREVNATRYTAREFRMKIAAKDHFLSDVLRGPKHFVKGDQRDLVNAVPAVRPEDAKLPVRVDAKPW